MKQRCSRLLGCSVTASAQFCLGMLAFSACSFGDGEPRLAVHTKAGRVTAASPTPGIQLPTPPGTTNLSDIPPLPAGTGKRNVIVMIGDGMQMAHEVATSRYLYDSDQGLSFHSLPVRAFKTTWDVNVYTARAQALGVAGYSPEQFDPSVGYDPKIGGKSPYPIEPDSDTKRAYFVGGPYPDSASTATAMSTGLKTLSAAIGVPPEFTGNNASEHASSLLRRFYGMSVGFVTTVQFYHATPSGFFAHNVSRNAYSELAHELMTEVMPEVMIGGGFGRGEFDEADLLHLQGTGNYVYAHRQTGVDGGDTILAAASRAVQGGKRHFGLYGNLEEGNFSPPKPADNPGNPTTTRGSLEDPTLADASIAALQVLSQDKDGFFIMIEQGDIDRANHANDFARMIGCVSDLDAAVRAAIGFVDNPNDDIDWNNTTLIVTADHANSYMRFTRTLHSGDLPTQAGSTYPDGEITYGWGSHTSELVNVYVKGYAESLVAAYETPYPGLPIIDDTSIYRLIVDAARR